MDVAEYNAATTKSSKLSKTNLQGIVLSGDTVQLVPLESCHAADLFRNYEGVEDKFIWTWPRAKTLDEFQKFISNLAADDTNSTFAVVLRSNQEAIGSTSFMEIRPEHKGLEIGSTWYAASHQGTNVNPECKLLLLEYAFEKWNAERVQLKTDARNLHSRAAILKLGAQFEGILRKHILLKDGFVRDTAMYSITKEDWQSVRINLEQRLTRQQS